jgi:hypothetical protein
MIVSTQCLLLSPVTNPCRYVLTSLGSLYIERRGLSPVTSGDTGLTRWLREWGIS